MVPLLRDYGVWPALTRQIIYFWAWGALYSFIHAHNHYALYTDNYIVALNYEDFQENNTRQRISLQFACLLMTLLEKTQSVATSVIFYQLLKSGDVEQNPGPGSYNIP